VNTAEKDEALRVFPPFDSIDNRCSSPSPPTAIFLLTRFENFYFILFYFIFILNDNSNAH